MCSFYQMKLDGKEGVFCCSFVTSVFSFNDTGLSSLLFPKTVLLNMFNLIQDNNQKVLNYFEIYYLHFHPCRHIRRSFSYFLSYLSQNFDSMDRLEKISNEIKYEFNCCLLYTSPRPRDKRQSRMPSSA